MYVYEGLGVSFNIKTLGKAVKNLGNAALKPLTTKISLNPITQVKNLTHSGIAIGKAAEKTVVAINPLDTTLKRFDEAGIKAGGIGKLLGKTGEAARKNPIATTALVAAIVVGGTAAAGSAGTSTSGAGAAGAGAGAAGAGSGSVLSTAMSWVVSNPSTAGSILSAGAKLAASRGAKPEDINPDTGMPYYALTEEEAVKSSPMLAGMFTGQNIMLFVGLSALTVAGYMLFNQPQQPQRSQKRR